MKGSKFLPLENLALKTMRRFGMIEAGERVLIGVSGGADSVALLLCLRRLAAHLRITLSAAHLNHRLRGTESDSDEDFVRKLCAGLGIDLISESAPVMETAAASKQNLEEAARHARYDFLRRIAQQTGAGKIAVGHTLNDQAETVLLRFFRGSGAGGLAAIHPVVDETIIRPLLEINRADILRYLEDLKIPHREDSSNRDLSLRRNRLRHDLIPRLERDFNPRLLETLAREANLARETSDFLEQVSRATYSRLKSPIRGGILLPIEELRAMHPLLQKLLLRLALRDVRRTLRDISARHIEFLIRLCQSGQSGQRIELPGGATAIRRFKNIAILKSRPEAGPTFEYVLSLPGHCTVREAGMEIVATIMGREDCDLPRKASPKRVILDGDALPDALAVRSRRPGDRYGGPGHRKIKKMLIDAHIDAQSRSSLPVIAAGDAVVWIPGFRPATRYAARPDSLRLVVLEASSLQV